MACIFSFFLESLDKSKFLMQSLKFFKPIKIVSFYGQLFFLYPEIIELYFKMVSFTSKSSIQ